MFWREQATAPEVYADEYVAARAAIKAVDRTTPVVSAGLLDANAMDPNVFLRRMIRRQPSLRRGIDAVGYHPYQMAYARMRYGIVRLRQTMNALRMGVGADRDHGDRHDDRLGPGGGPRQRHRQARPRAPGGQEAERVAVHPLRMGVEPPGRRLRPVLGDHERRRHADPDGHGVPLGYRRTIENEARFVAPEGSSDCRR